MSDITTILLGFDPLAGRWADGTVPEAAENFSIELGVGLTSLAELTKASTLSGADPTDALPGVGSGLANAARSPKPLPGKPGNAPHHREALQAGYTQHPQPSQQAEPPKHAGDARQSADAAPIGDAPPIAGAPRMPQTQRGSAVQQATDPPRTGELPPNAPTSPEAPAMQAESREGKATPASDELRQAEPPGAARAMPLAAIAAAEDPAQAPKLDHAARQVIHANAPQEVPSQGPLDLAKAEAAQDAALSATTSKQRVDGAWQQPGGNARKAERLPDLPSEADRSHEIGRSAPNTAQTSQPGATWQTAREMMPPAVAREAPAFTAYHPTRLNAALVIEADATASPALATQDSHERRPGEVHSAHGVLPPVLAVALEEIEPVAISLPTPHQHAKNALATPLALKEAQVVSVPQRPISDRVDRHDPDLAQDVPGQRIAQAPRSGAGERLTVREDSPVGEQHGAHTASLARAEAPLAHAAEIPRKPREGEAKRTIVNRAVAVESQPLPRPEARNLPPRPASGLISSRHVPRGAEKPAHGPAQTQETPRLVQREAPLPESGVASKRNPVRPQQEAASPRTGNQGNALFSLPSRATAGQGLTLALAQPFGENWRKPTIVLLGGPRAEAESRAQPVRPAPARAAQQAPVGVQRMAREEPLLGRDRHSSISEYLKNIDAEMPHSGSAHRAEQPERAAKRLASSAPEPQPTKAEGVDSAVFVLQFSPPSSPQPAQNRRTEAASPTLHAKSPAPARSASRQAGKEMDGAHTRSEQAKGEQNPGVRSRIENTQTVKAQGDRAPREEARNKRHNSAQRDDVPNGRVLHGPETIAIQPPVATMSAQPGFRAWYPAPVQRLAQLPAQGAGENPDLRRFDEGSAQPPTRVLPSSGQDEKADIRQIAAAAIMAEREAFAEPAILERVPSTLKVDDEPSSTPDGLGMRDDWCEAFVESRTDAAQALPSDAVQPAEPQLSRLQSLEAELSQPRLPEPQPALPTASAVQRDKQSDAKQGAAKNDAMREPAASSPQIITVAEDKNSISNDSSLKSIDAEAADGTTAGVATSRPEEPRDRAVATAGQPAIPVRDEGIPDSAGIGKASDGYREPASTVSLKDLGPPPPPIGGSFAESRGEKVDFAPSQSVPLPAESSGSLPSSDNLAAVTAEPPPGADQPATQPQAASPPTGKARREDIAVERIAVAQVAARAESVVGFAQDAPVISASANEIRAQNKAMATLMASSTDQAQVASRMEASAEFAADPRGSAPIAEIAANAPGASLSVEITTGTPSARPNAEIATALRIASVPVSAPSVLTVSASVASSTPPPRGLDDGRIDPQAIRALPLLATAALRADLVEQRAGSKAFLPLQGESLPAILQGGVTASPGAQGSGVATSISQRLALTASISPYQAMIPRSAGPQPTPQPARGAAASTSPQNQPNRGTVTRQESQPLPVEPSLARAGEAPILRGPPPFLLARISPQLGTFVRDQTIVSMVAALPTLLPGILLPTPRREAPGLQIAEQQREGYWQVPLGMSFTQTMPDRFWRWFERVRDFNRRTSFEPVQASADIAPERAVLPVGYA